MAKRFEILDSELSELITVGNSVVVDKIELNHSVNELLSVLGFVEVESVFDSLFIDIGFFDVSMCWIVILEEFENLVKQLVAFLSSCCHTGYTLYPRFYIESGSRE